MSVGIFNIRENLRKEGKKYTEAVVCNVSKIAAKKIEKDRVRQEFKKTSEVPRRGFDFDNLGSLLFPEMAFVYGNSACVGYNGAA